MKCDTCGREKDKNKMKKCPKCKKYHCNNHYGPENECHTCVYSSLSDAIMGFRKNKGDE